MALNGDSALAMRFLKAKRDLFDRYYSDLNPQQREAVYTVNGPLLVLAGAGSGKTTVLTSRIVHIIKFGNAYASELVPDDISETDIDLMDACNGQNRDEAEILLSRYAVSPCPPWAIMSITFTNKAAKEMQERLHLKVHEDATTSAEDIWSGTFHSICLRILRRYSKEAGYNPGFTIYDSDDSKRLILHIMKDLNIDENGLNVRTVMNGISRAKDRLLTPARFEAQIGSDFIQKQIASIYYQYEHRLKEANVMDFDDIILNTVNLLAQNQEIRDYYQQRFRYICVDEYQDTNNAQFELIRMLSGRYHNLMVVGDDDQSIYKFRGARVENILNFDRELHHTKVIKLEQNYRSTQNILNAANAVIANNVGRRGKQLFTDNGEGEKVVIHKNGNQLDEAKYIINKIAELSIREKRRFSDFAILYRTNAQANTLEQVFSRSGIPYRVLGGLRFYERKEVKDILSYLCVISNLEDNLRLRRIINEPKRKIGETTVTAVEHLALVEKKSMFEIMEISSRYTALAKSSSKLKDFTAMIRGLQDIALTEPLPKLIEETISRTGYRQMLLESGPEGLDRLDNVNEMITNAAEYVESHDNPTLESFLEEVSLVADIDNYDTDADAVVMMTIHSSKGLEFPVLFIPGCEEGIFPSAQAAMYPDELEEERRLAYVAITRAKERLYLLHTHERMLYGRTQFNPISRFLKEIPVQYVDPDMGDKAAEMEKKRRAERPRRNLISKEFMKQADSATGIARVASSLERFKVGDIVEHANFGRGEILSATDLGGDILYEIVFDNFGTKKLMSTYARLKRVENEAENQ